MPIYQNSKDLLREKAAMAVMGEFFEIPFRKGKDTRVDFCSINQEYVCEHKWRKLDEEAIARLGGEIFFEKKKYRNLQWAIRNGGMFPLFVVTLLNGNIYFLNVKGCEKKYVSGTAYRNNPRDDFDSDPCYMVPLIEFQYAGTTPYIY